MLYIRILKNIFTYLNYIKRKEGTYLIIFVFSTAKPFVTETSQRIPEGICSTFAIGVLLLNITFCTFHRFLLQNRYCTTNEIRF